MFARRVAEENNRSEQLGQIRGALLLLCVLRTVCIFVFVCGESSALSLAICFPGGPTGASPASRGGPDSSGIWRTGPVGLPGESSSHISASSPSASTFFFPLFSSGVVLFCLWGFVPRPSHLSPSVTFLHVPSRRSSSCSDPSRFPSWSHSQPIFTLLFALAFAFFFFPWTWSLGWLGRPVLVPVVALACRGGRSGRDI